MSTTTAQRLTLDHVHQQAGATFRELDGWLVPANYGDTLAEYTAVRDGGAGLFDLSARGRIRVSGSEATMFLNGLITNDMKTLAENHWMPAVFPNVQGRLLAVVRIARVGEEAAGKGTSPVFLIDTEATTHRKVLEIIQRFTLAGDFRVSDLTNQTVLLSVQGKAATEIVSKVFNASIAALPHDGSTDVNWNGPKVNVTRASHTAENGFDICVESEHAAASWEALVSAGARPVGYDALEILRVEAGVAKFGRDMDETNVVTETNLDDAVSFTKGCYLGQEIIVRIKHRGHVAKKLRGLLFDTDEEIATGATITGDGEKEIGRVTSALVSPKLEKAIGLGFVRFEYTAPETKVVVVTGENKVEARITEFPFVRGSWYQG
jgi:folate-binding protein YgfZ